MVDNKPTIDEQMAAIHERFGFQHSRIPPRSTGNVERFYECVRTGGALVATRRFVDKEVQYNPGDPYPYDPSHAEKLVVMAEHNYLKPAAELREAHVLNAMRDLLDNTVSPAYRRLQAMRAEAAQLAVAVSDKEAALAHAKVAARDAAEHVKGAEAEVEKLLAGPDVKELFS
jgi:hypothetical protein